MANRWETMETVSDFILGGSKITADSECSHEIKRCLLLGRKAMTSLYSILKSRDVTLPTEVHLVKTMVFPVVRYGCESWTIKKAESLRIDAFELWCWRRLLRGPWTARRSNRSILKGINPEYSLKDWCWSWNSNPLAILWRNDSLEKTLLLGKIEDRRRRGWQRMRWLASQLNGHEFEQALRVGDGLGGLVYCSPWARKESDTTEQLNWISLFKGDFNRVTRVQWLGLCTFTAKALGSILAQGTKLLQAAWRGKKKKKKSLQIIPSSMCHLLGTWLVKRQQRSRYFVASICHPQDKLPPNCGLLLDSYGQ